MGKHFVIELSLNILTNGLLCLTISVNDRWDFAATEQLPDYMKICFKAVYDSTNEIAYKVYKDLYGWNPMNSLQKVVRL